MVYNIISNQESHCIAKDMWQWANEHRTKWSNFLSHFPVTASLIEQYVEYIVEEQNWRGKAAKMEYQSPGCGFQPKSRTIKWYNKHNKLKRKQKQPKTSSGTKE